MKHFIYQCYEIVTLGAEANTLSKMTMWKFLFFLILS